MFEDKNSGVVFLIIVFVLVAIVGFVAGIIAIASPMTVVNMARPFAGILNMPVIGNFLGIDWNGAPLVNYLPMVGVVAIIAAVVILIDVWGLWTEKSWAWILSVLISIVACLLIIGFIFIWILFKEDVKMSYGQM